VSESIYILKNDSLLPMSLPPDIFDIGAACRRISDPEDGISRLNSRFGDVMRAVQAVRSLVFTGS
jgi:hypothetical protein